MVVGVGADPAELDPAGNMINFTALSVRNALYDGLFTAAPGRDPAPALALSLTEAPDRLRWALKLRPGVLFQDGSPFDAAAVKFNLERQKRSRFQGTTAAVIATIDVVDPLTVSLGVKKPYTAMRHLLADTSSIGLMVSPKAVAAKAKEFGRAPVGAGTGPYQFKEWVTGDHITVTRNPKYWGDRKPRLDEIVFKVIPDEAGQLNALRAGDVHVMAATLPETARKAKSAGLQVVEPAFAGYAIVLMNNAKPPFDDVRVRRAVMLGIDTDSIAKIAEDPFYDKRGFGLWPQGNPWYSPPTEPLTFDPAEAKKLIADYEKAKGPIKVGLLLPSRSQTLIDVSRLIVKNMQSAGMEVTLTVQPDVNQAVVSILFGLYDMAGFVTPLHGDPDLTAFTTLHSKSVSNLSKYKSPEMDAALEAGRSAADPATRKAAYSKVQQLMRRDVPFLVSSPASVRLAFAKTVCGIGTDADFFPAKTAGFTC